MLLRILFGASLLVISSVSMGSEDTREWVKLPEKMPEVIRL